MKHLISLLAIAAMLSGCSSSSDNFDDPIVPPTPAPETPNATKVLMGTSRSSEFFPMSTVVDDDDIIANNGDVLIYKAPQTYDGATEKTFTQFFPYKQNNLDRYYDITTGTYKQRPEGLENFSIDFVYVSDGTPYRFYPIHSSVSYDDVIGLFYWDTDKQFHTLDFWNMQEVGWKPYGQYREITVSQDAEGYTIKVPEGYVFGFYIWAPNELQYRHQNRQYSGHFYTMKDLNLADGADCDHRTDGGIHGSTFAIDGKTYIGFEDQENGDKDINDVICFITPEVPIIDNPTQEQIDSIIESTKLSGEVEVDIHQQDHEDGWNEIKTAIHIRDTVNVRVTIPIGQEYISEQDDFAIRTYEAYYYKGQGNEKYPVIVTIEHNADNITIDVSGITAAMLKALREEGDDGITIEVHSYYKALTDDELWEKIKLSTVSTYKNRTTIYGQIHRKEDPRSEWVPIGEGPKVKE